MGALLGIFQNRRAAGFPLIKAVGAQLFATGSAPTAQNPDGVAKGWLRSRSISFAVIGFTAWLLSLTGWVSVGTITTLLDGLTAAGFGGAAVFRAMAKVPTR